MSKKALKITKYKPEELLSFLNEDKEYKKFISLYVCYQISLGKKAKDLEDIFQVSFKTIYNWIHKLNKYGIEGLITKKYKGRISKLSIKQMEQINLMLNDIPSNYGYPTSAWTGLIMIDWIEKNFKIKYKKAQIYNIFKKLGFRNQKGKVIHHEIKVKNDKVKTNKKN